jgi:hypothetical protein
LGGRQKRVRGYMGVENVGFWLAFTPENEKQGISPAYYYSIVQKASVELHGIFIFNLVELLFIIRCLKKS